MKYHSMIIIVALFAVGCTNINVRKVDSEKHSINHLCIQENPKVNVADFISVMKEKFSEHKITSEVYSGSATPKHCLYYVKYTAKRSWDVTHYIGYAEIEIYNKNNKIGEATYKQAGGSASFSLNKWGTTLEKIGPVIDEMLSQFNN